MIGALIILGFLVAVGIILYLGELRHRRKEADLSDSGNEETSTQIAEISGLENNANKEEGVEDENSGECCGLHLVCEKDSLSPMSAEIIYYDDEELDRFIGRTGMDYTPEETEEFRDVLMTLRPQDVSGWARSITARRLELPPEVRDELLLLVNEQRANRS